MEKLSLFDRTYTGPRGPHLAFRTHKTRHGQIKHGPRAPHTSIHNRPVFID